MPGTRGRRNPALLERRPEPAPAPEETTGKACRYYVGRRPVQHHGRIYKPGDPVPDAHTWPRLESKVALGILVDWEA